MVDSKNEQNKIKRVINTKKPKNKILIHKKRNDFIQVDTTQDSISISKCKLTQKQEITV